MTGGTFQQSDLSNTDQKVSLQMGDKQSDQKKTSDKSNNDKEKSNVGKLSGKETTKASLRQKIKNKIIKSKGTGIAGELIAKNKKSLEGNEALGKSNTGKSVDNNPIKSKIALAYQKVKIKRKDSQKLSKEQSQKEQNDKNLSVTKTQKVSDLQLKQK